MVAARKAVAVVATDLDVPTPILVVVVHQSRVQLKLRRRLMKRELAEALLNAGTGLAEQTQLPSVFARLMLARQLLAHRFLRPEGSFFLECFARFTPLGIKFLLDGIII